MDHGTRELLRRRAEYIGRTATDLLLDGDGTDVDAAEGHRYSWLMLRGPESLLEQFGEESLSLDPEALERFLWRHCDHLSGGSSLLKPEREIIEVHNLESGRFLMEQRRRSRNPPVPLMGRHSQTYAPT